MKVLVLGCTGMLGSAVTKYLVELGHDVSVTCRSKSFPFAIKWLGDIARIVPKVMIFDPVVQDIKDFRVSEFEYVINCIGVIKPAVKVAGFVDTIEINGVFPHKLAKWCGVYNDVGCINITTDCVYSGTKGGYIETDKHDVDDLYGRSKSIGEDTEFGMTIRTSIVGEEIHNNASLIEWAKLMCNQRVNGFTNHFWNGITTTQYAEVVDQIMTNGMFNRGLFHVFSPTPVTKFRMLELFNQRFNLGLRIDPMMADISVDRTLSTVKNLNEKLHIPEFECQVAEM